MNAQTFEISPAGEEDPRRRVFVYNGGFLTQKRVRRILSLSGYDIKLGWPSSDDMVAIWGNSPTAYRGTKVALKSGVGLLRVEDAFLRSLHPGRLGEQPIGLLIDHSGVHFDPSAPSDLETFLNTDPLDDAHMLRRARHAVERIKDAHLTKYNGFDVTQFAPEPGYVLVIDQVRNDASVTASEADDALFQEMLVLAQEEHPGARVVIKTHPETQRGFRPGFYGAKDVNERVSLWDSPISPWLLFEGAVGVYTVSSQMGFEAIYAGHRPRVFGKPFYMGWGLTEDAAHLPRRTRRLTKTQLFAAAMVQYPAWYDPARDAICEIEDVIGHLEAKARAWREDHSGWQARNIRLWKRKHFQQFFGQSRSVTFASETALAGPGKTMVWGSAKAPASASRVEDGFLRSRGLGAELVPPLSLVLDDLGIYYDPQSPSRLEALIAKRARLSDSQEDRATRLIEAITQLGVSKYNLSGSLPALPDGKKILVPGQVEDDASILKGTDHICTDAALLQATRLANPEAQLIYKPHPDVVAGLRDADLETASPLADLVIKDGNIDGLLNAVDEVWTMTSLAGFEALLRGRAVTTFGAPFYAGWGLTRDMGQVPTRRQARPSLAGLVHAVLIDYPRYFDPKTNTACPVEVAIERLASGDIPKPSAAHRLLAKTQGVFASYSGLWR